jgi:hypothetical protein
MCQLHSIFSLTNSHLPIHQGQDDLCRVSCNKHRFHLFSIIAVTPRGSKVDSKAKQKQTKTKKLITLCPSESQLFIKFDSSNWDTGLPRECRN